MNGRGPGHLPGPHTDATTTRIDGRIVTQGADRTGPTPRLSVVRTTTSTTGPATARVTEALYRGRDGARLQLDTCAPSRFRHVWDVEQHPRAGFWMAKCLHCSARAAVPFVGEEVGQ